MKLIDFLKIRRSFSEGGQTLEDDTVTVRDRDTTEQKRHKISSLPENLR